MATQTITKSVTATDTEVAGLWTAYLLVVAMLVVPNFILIHPYLHLLILGPLLVWIGCQRALLEAQKAPGESNVEVVSKKDAMQFPLIGSCALFSLYLVVKFIKKALLPARPPPPVPVFPPAAEREIEAPHGLSEPRPRRLRAGVHRPPHLGLLCRPRHTWCLW